jgi:hypothetical protein
MLLGELMLILILKPLSSIVITPILIISAPIELVFVPIFGNPSLHHHNIGRFAPRAFRYISLNGIVLKFQDEFGFVGSIGNEIEFFPCPGHRHIE